MKNLDPLLILIIPFFSFSSFSQTIVNGYANVSGVGASTITVSAVDETFDTFEDGEQVIIMQMQDNVIGTTSNSINFGDVGSLQSVGKFEVKTIASHTETGAGVPVNVTFTDPLLVTYNTGTNTSVQLITFPELGAPNYVTTNNLTAKSWDGAIGGIVAFQVPGTLTLAHDINVDGTGFRGAIADKNQSCGGNICESTVYISQWTSRALKGEGIYKNINPNFEAARGRLLNGGGGGSCHNGAGGGGSNYSSGGDGGIGWGCKNTTVEAGGFGGLSLGSYINPSRVFMGGGGGAGERNNGHNTSGGNGGGIILIKADTIETSGACGGITISANGQSTPDIGNDGAGGAGAGGIILMDIGQWNIASSCNISVEASGGNGGSSLSGGIHGGGGGGGQGAIMYTNKAPSTNVINITTPGDGGCGNTSVPCNSTAGTGGGTPNAGVIGGGGGPLPVELIYFTADLVEDEVHFGWQTASEQNSDYFVIERMDNDGEWYEITEVKANGNTTSLSSYEAFDLFPQVGDNYYRLVQIDKNGLSKTYDPKVVHVEPEQFGRIVLYPNPTNGLVNVFSLDNNAELTIKVYDTRGALVDMFTMNGQQEKQLDMSGLPKGMYFVEANDVIQKLILGN